MIPSPPSPSPTSNGSATGKRPLISVLIPEARDDPRSDSEFLRSWTRNQTVEPGVYEVIVAMKEGDSELEASFRESLRNQDRLIVADFENCIACYNAANEVASGRFILLTENHTIATPDCIEKLVAFLERTGAKAASLRSEFRNFNYLDRHEENLYRSYHQEKWTREEEWNRVRLRGFAIDRTLFGEVGGLPEDYGLFAEEFLSAELALRGVKIDHVDDSSIEHVNVGSFAHLRHDIHEFVDGECIYRDRDYTSRHAVYFGEPESWSDRAIHVPGFRGKVASACGRILRSLMLGESDSQERLARILLPRYLTLTIAGLVPRGLVPAWLEIPVQWHRLLAFLFQGSSKFGLDSFERMWAATRRKRELQFLLRHPQPNSRPSRTEFVFGEAGPPQIFGFYPLEEYHGRGLRWSGPVAAVRLDLIPEDLDVEIETGLIRGPAEDIPLGIAFNDQVIGNRALAPGVEASSLSFQDDGRICFSLKKEWFVEGEQLLVLCVAPLPRRAGETRELGIPVLDVTFRPPTEFTSTMTCGSTTVREASAPAIG